MSSGIFEIRIAEGNNHFRVSGDFLVSTDDNSVVRYFGDEAELEVGGEIESLSSKSFSRSTVRILTFANDSHLRRIESFAFVRSSLRVICIPSSVDWIDGSSFAGCDICEIRVAEGNRHFRVSAASLTNYDGTSIIRYFGRAAEVRISCEVETIGVGSFSFCDLIRQLDFESPSKVQWIGDRAFEKCTKLRSISIPPSIESLGEWSFGKCKDLQEVRIEAGSQLRRMGAESFGGCASLKSVFVPMSVRANEGIELEGSQAINITWYE
jgi:hypothetical protein